MATPIKELVVIVLWFQLDMALHSVTLLVSNKGWEKCTELRHLKVFTPKTKGGNLP